MSDLQNERRLAVRHKIEFIVSISKDDILVSANNAIINISKTGCLVKLAAQNEFQIGDRVILRIEEKFLKEKFHFELDEIEAEVARKTEGNQTEVGLHFLFMTQKNALIVNYIIANGLFLKEFPKAWQIAR